MLTDITTLAKSLVIPASVLVEVCHICNEDCIHCCLDQHKKKGLTLDQYGTLFDQMVDAGTFYVILTGGEPFVRPDFMDIVVAARKRRLSVTIFSNATLITDDDIRRLHELCIEEIHVSIYSANRSLHDAITRVPGSFDRSINTISRMKAIGITVRLKCPLMNVTADDISRLKDLGHALEVDIQFSLTITAKKRR